LQSNSQQTAANNIKAMFDRQVIFQQGKCSKTADANLLQRPFFVEKKLGHSLNQPRLQQLCKLQERLYSPWESPNLKISNDPDHTGAQIASVSSKHVLVG